MKIKLLIIFVLISSSFCAQNETISVIRHTEKDIVTPKDLKVIYRGIPNELFIDVPNSKSFEVSGNFVSKKDKNNYNVNPGAGLETIVTISIILKNNKKVTEKYTFRIRNVASIIPTFNKMEGQIIKVQKSAFKNAIVGAKVADKNIEEFIEVTQFTIKIPGMGAIVIDGNKIDNKTYEKLVKNVSKGDEVVISDIKTRFKKLGCGIICSSTAPMVIQVL